METSDFKKSNTYVKEIVWLPSYFGIAIFLVSVFDAGTLIIFPSLLACRMFLELVYRIVFGERRNEFGCQSLAFLVQCIVWAVLWGLHVARLGTT